jgi:hypothetical protein
MRRLLRWLTRDPATVMSPRWLHEQARLTSRIQYDGPSWSWPVDKAANDCTWWVRRGRASKHRAA